MLASIAISVCAARALWAGVQLIDERALFEIRARDVFTRNPPLLGLRSSSAEATREFNHLGPALFWWLAPFVRVLGGPVGVTVGVASLNVGSVWLAVLAARESGGPRLALATGVCATVLCWVLGSELVVDPWQPNVLVLPCFALLAVTAAVVGGGWRWLPATAALASLCVQTHLGYLLLGSALLATAVAWLVWRSSVEGRSLPWRIIAPSALIVAVLWSPVLWQQFFGPGRGNLGAVLTAATGEGDRVGLAVALQLWSAVTMIPPAWFRPSYRDPPQALLRVEADAAGLHLGDLPSMWLTLLTVLIAVGIAGLVVTSARRYRIDGSRAGMLVAVIGTLAAVATVALLTVDLFGVVAHKYRYFWSLAAYATSVVVGHGIGVVDVIVGRRGVRSTMVGLAAVASLVAVLAIPTQPLDQGGVSNRGLWPSLRELRSQLASYRPSGVVEVETNGLPFPDHYSHAVLAQLSENGLRFQVTTDTMVGQLGRARAADGSASHRLIVRQAPNDAEPVPGARLISRVQLHNAPSVAVFEVTE